MENRLTSLKNPTYLTTEGLLDLYKDYKNPRDKIKNLVAQKHLLRVRKNLYLLGTQYKHHYSKEVLANLIYGPSAISLEYALFYYGLIPERVEVLTSICFKRNKKFITDLGLFTYKYIAEELFPIGIQHQQSKEGNFLIASKEKALCDVIYFAKLKSEEDVIKHVTESLRIEEEDLSKLDFSLLAKLAKIYRRSAVVHLVSELTLLKGQTQ